MRRSADAEVQLQQQGPRLDWSAAAIDPDGVSVCVAMRTRAWRRLIACIVAIAVSAPALAGAAAPRPLTVFAAASLKESLDVAARTYEARTGQQVRVSYAASSALARQIEAGAPADVFIAADRDWMDALQAQGRIDPRTRRSLLGNTLVLIAPAASRTPPIRLQRGVDLARHLGRNGRIALAMPASVPAGKYAKAAFVHLGIWTTLAARVAEAENVRAALMLVARGEAPLGVVYGSDARVEPKVRVVATFPARTHPPIVYPVARVTASTHAHASPFVQWLASAEADRIFQRHGLIPLP